MEIKDGVPERRNLTMLAMTIIVFYIGEATFDGGKATLMLLNVEFHNLVALKYLAFVMLCWFLFRYIVVIRQIFVKKLLVEMKYMDAKKGLINCYGMDLGLTLVEVVWVGWCKHNRRLAYKWSKNDASFYPKKRLCFYKYLIVDLVKQFFTRPTISAYISPILLALIAFAIPVIGLTAPKVMSDNNATAIVKKVDSNKTAK